MKKVLDITSRLDPELAAVFATFPKPEGVADVATHRANLKALVGAIRATVPVDPDILVEDRKIPGRPGDPAVPVRILRPKQGGTGGVLVWIHGGGFVAGDHEDDQLIAEPWVRGTGCTIVSVGYRLAPEAKHPSALHDCYAALKWVADPSGPLGFVPRKVAIGGMSAGGCLAAATAIYARDQGGPVPCFQMLLIPVIDNRHDTPSFAEFHDPRIWRRETSLDGWTMYGGPGFMADASPYLAPGRATDLSGLPPAFIEVSEIDTLRDEAITYANRLMQAGVATELHVYAGAYHASAVVSPGAAVSRRALANSTAALKAALA